MKSVLKFLFWFHAAFITVFLILFAILPLPGDIPVLMYHFIDTPERAAVEKNVVSRESFEKQMRFLKTFGYRILTLDEYYEIHQGARKPKGRELLITFDDGNYTFKDQAFEILRSYYLPSAMFVVSGNVPDQIYGSMGEEALKELSKSGLVTFGSHSKTHPLLSTLTPETVKAEMEDSKKELEAMLGVPVHYLAYPSGDLNEEVIAAARRAGYRLAFTTSHKKLGGLSEGPYSITRVKISRTSDFLFAFWVKISGLYGGFKGILARFG